MPDVPKNENPNSNSLMAPVLWDLIKTILTLENCLENCAIVIANLERIQKTYHPDAPICLPEILADLEVQISS
jgi:hypothetical protein